MIGNNKLVLNHATICTAVQYWLENEVLAGDMCGDIRVDAVSHTNVDNEFTVYLESPEKDK